MESLQCFEPQFHELNLTKQAALLVAIIGVSSVLIVWYFGRRKIHYQYRNLFLMLLGFVVLISLGIYLFSYWNTTKLSKVCISGNELIIGEESLRPENITRYFIYLDKQKDKLVQLGPSEEYKLLIIETPYKQYVLSEHHYQVDDIYQCLKKRLFQNN